MKTLTAKRIARLGEGRHRDPETRGLYLQVGPVSDKSPTGTRSWLLRYELDGRERFMGLGSLADFTLKEARERARAARQKLADGVDPIDARRAERDARALEAVRTTSFEAAAREYHSQHEGKWKNSKVVRQWLTVMERYAFPIIGKLPVADIDTGLVLRCLEQRHKSGKSLWLAVPETAGRVRQRLENVLDWATTRGYRAGENPARWKGHLANVLPAQGQIATVAHHAALPFAEIAAFMVELRQREGVAARALEFTILTAARTGEVTGAKWAEIDLNTKVWTVPAERMKGKKAHRVPLSDRAVKILKALPIERSNEFVFIGPRASGLSNAAMTSVLRRMGRADITTHGFRSSFRDWCAERTNYPNHVVEMALAHTISNAVEAAYRRGDLFAKRTQLMREWAAYCSGPAPAAEVVVPLRAERRRSAATGNT